MSYTDPDGEWIVAAIGLAVTMGMQYTSALSSGASRSDALMSAVGAGIIAGQTLLFGPGVQHGLTTAIGGRFGGLAGIGLAGGALGAYSNFSSGLLGGSTGVGALGAAGNGALSQGVGSIAGAYVAGPIGAFTRGIVSSTIAGTLSGQTAGHIGLSSIVSGTLNTAAYFENMAAAYSDFRAAGGSLLSKEQFMGMSYAAQVSFGRGREWGAGLAERVESILITEWDNRTLQIHQTDRQPPAIGMLDSTLIPLLV